ncbi:MAG: hypothetical protein Q8M92_10805 [Candidatus Subteraquimicrobiales bacterium]|nr:hypothetical protein [Candidatus Subteraquimicrobiales bacterium]
MSYTSCTLDEVKEMVKKKAKERRLSCPMARKIAEELNISPVKVGEACNELKIKLYGCELGCFK